MSRILIAYTNPWSFTLAVERALAAEHSGSRVDVLNLNLLSEHEKLLRPIDRAVERLSRKYERFIAPIATGRDITSEIALRLRTGGFPPIPTTLRSYTYQNCRVGLAVLSSITSLTTIQFPLEISEYGSALPLVWRTAHLSAEVGQVVADQGYDAVYIFNGRHAISRPFCDIVQRATTVYRYEQGGTGNRYIISPQSIHDPRTVAGLIREHNRDASAGEEFFEARLRKAVGSGAEFFTASQQYGLVPPEAQPDRTVVFFSSSSDEMYAVSDQMSYGSFESQQAIALAMAEVCAAHGYVLVIRLHPHLRFKHPSWKREWDFAQLRARGAVIVAPEDSVDSYALLRAARCIVSCGSTVNFEASYLGVPSADVGSWTGGVLGACAIVSDAQQLADFITHPVSPAGAREQAISFGSYMKRAGTLLPELDVGSHPYYARIGGRIVDPIRFGYQKLRSPLSPTSRIALPPGGKLIVEPSVLKEVARQMHSRRA